MRVRVTHGNWRPFRNTSSDLIREVEAAPQPGAGAAAVIGVRMRDHDHVDCTEVYTELSSVALQRGSRAGAEPKVEENCPPVCDYEVGAVVSGSWLVSWAGRLIETVLGRSRIFGAWAVPKRCGVRARASVSTVRRWTALSVANP